MKRVIYLFGLLSCLLSACSKEDLGESLIDTSTPILNETDQWIRTNYTTPFNVEVKYKWDRSELDQTKILTPAELNRIIPFLDNMKKLWIDPYVHNAGIDFMKKYIPKQLVLVGSHNFNDNGSIVLGQAEGGRKVTIFDLNYINFDLSSLEEWQKSQVMEVILRTFRTMHHEFGHILHQTVAYPLEYKKITTNYTSNWTNFTDGDAREMGFITAYGMLNPDEDFVEMLSFFVTMTNKKWNAIIDRIYVYDDNYNYDEAATNKAKSALRQKEKILVDYMAQVWKIDLYALQAEVSSKLNAIETGSN